MEDRMEAVGWLRGLTRRVTAAERGTLLALVIVGVGLFGFARVALEVADGDTHSLDHALLLALRSEADPTDPWGPGWFEEMMRDFTALGGTGVLLLVTATVFGFLLLTGRRQAAMLVLLSIASGVVVSHGLKWGFGRPRPDLVPHGQSVYSQSFPSGHAMLSAIVYLTLGALLSRVQERRRAKVYPLVVAALLVLLIGFSRVYLGVHWPSDVLAGWAVGAGWAALCWLILLTLQRRGQT
ncbi:phosphatase PAP2 family protein [Sabulicella glaciei]|uniref:Phosphatase PAP2 family protein n=1 Tax=Sabulicella glaciei TaxID=2984948 RepID=A0ABT3NSL4_9PROT|nr:phosphatase PAP2 family protein [Roseococcus sp. MDT2-1-1]MCW8085142.1 phosphatase PAP2 family protein [Roseococcus sp. MDT2-1-1]